MNHPCPRLPLRKALPPALGRRASKSILFTEVELLSPSNTKEKSPLNAERGRGIAVPGRGRGMVPGAITLQESAILERMEELRAQARYGWPEYPPALDAASPSQHDILNFAGVRLSRSAALITTTGRSLRFFLPDHKMWLRRPDEN